MTDQSNEDNELKEEQKFFTAIKTAIDHEVDAKTISLAKSNQPYDKAKIKAQCEKTFFSQIQHEWEKIAEKLSPFFLQLKHDHPDLLNKMQEGVPSSVEKLTESIKNCKKLSDFNKLSPTSKLTAEEIKELNRTGRKWFREHAFDKALSYFLFLITCDPNNVENWLAKGMAEQNLTNYDDALISYSTVLNLAPDYALCYLQIIECLIHKKQWEAAQQCYSAFVENTKPEEYRHDAFLTSKVKNIELFLNASLKKRH